MTKLVDLSGQQIFEWTVLYRLPEPAYPTRWVCLCSCGKQANVLAAHLKTGGSRSCGCKTGEFLSKSLSKHGGYKDGKNTPTYQSYIAMMHRCYNNKRVSWDNYGGRGIIVDERSWLEETPNGYLNFLKDMGERPDNTTLDRIDSDKGYSKENCRWSDKRLQAYNSKRKKNSKSTSEFRGVSFARGRWVARIGNGKGSYTWLGSFSTEMEAAQAYNKAAIELWGENAMINDFSIENLNE